MHARFGSHRETTGLEASVGADFCLRFPGPRQSRSGDRSYKPMTSLVLLCLWTIVLSLVSCQANKQTPPANEVTISMAASTAEVVETLATAFTKKTGIAVKMNAGPSSGLANQILADAPADLFLAASRQWADEVDKAGKAEALHPLLTNSLVLIVPKGNPGEVQSPGDLLAESVTKVALASEKVPAGVYADQALTKLDLIEKLTTAGKIARGQDVRSALSYVERGEAEAGIVYSTDVRAASGVEVVFTFAPSHHDEIVYMLVLLKRGAVKPAARQFLDFLQSAEAGEVYRQAGFKRLQ